MEGLGTRRGRRLGSLGGAWGAPPGGRLRPDVRGVARVASVGSRRCARRNSRRAPRMFLSNTTRRNPRRLGAESTRMFLVEPIRRNRTRRRRPNSSGCPGQEHSRSGRPMSSHPARGLPLRPRTTPADLRLAPLPPQCAPRPGQRAARAPVWRRSHALAPPTPERHPLGGAARIRRALRLLPKS